MEKLIENSELNESDTQICFKTIIHKEKEINTNHNKNSYIEIKYPTFSIPQIDEDLKHEINYENLINDLRCVFELLEYYLNFYTEILVTNPHNILASFETYNLDFVIFHINSFLLKRQIELLSFIVKYKFENCLEIEKQLKEYVLEITLDDLISKWNSNYNHKGKILENFEIKIDIKEFFANELYNEKFMLENTLQNHEKPSLSSLGISIKYLKYILQTAIETMKILIKKESEENMLNFFHDVKFI